MENEHQFGGTEDAEKGQRLLASEHTCPLCALTIGLPFPDRCPNCNFDLPHLKQRLVTIYVFNETGLTPRP